MRVVSSHGAEFSTARTRISIGFLPVRRWIISKACFTMFITFAFLPAFGPGRMRLFARRSIILMLALRKRLCSCLPMLCGTTIGLSDMYFCKPKSLTFASL